MKDAKFLTVLGMTILAIAVVLSVLGLVGKSSLDPVLPILTLGLVVLAAALMLENHMTNTDQAEIQRSHLGAPEEPEATVVDLAAARQLAQEILSRGRALSPAELQELGPRRASE